MTGYLSDLEVFLTSGALSTKRGECIRCVQNTQREQVNRNDARHKRNYCFSDLNLIVDLLQGVGHQT